MGTTATEHEGKTETEPGDPQIAGTRVHGLLSLHVFTEGGVSKVEMTTLMALLCKV
jgi:hypothetical protein